MKTTIHSGDLQNAADNVWNAGTAERIEKVISDYIEAEEASARGGAGVRNLADLRRLAADGGDQ